MPENPVPPWYDITPLVSERLAVWPGDTPPRREILLDGKQGANITLSTLHATVHLGAHADAPSHYGTNAPSIESCDPSRYLGPCQVLHAPAGPRQRIGRKAISAPIIAPRVLVRTGSYPDPNHFHEGFAALDPSLIEWLADQGVTLIGIDTPSVDLFDSTDLPTHHACLRRHMAILEGLVLADVPEGRYELIALPLKLEGFDASPVRALLRALGP